MARREWAREFEAAPRARINNSIYELDESGGATPAVNITGLIPTIADADGAPFVDVLISYEILDPNSGPVALLAQAGFLATQAAYHRLTVAAGVATIRIRKVPLREAAASTTLLDGTQLWIRNTDAVNAYTDVAVTVEVPSVNWD